jgi:hypothetical protein
VRGLNYRALPAAGAFLGWLCLCGWALVWIDVYAAATLIPWPALMVRVALLAALTAPALVLALLCRQGWMRAVYAGSVLLALGLFVTPWHPRKVFVRDLYSVRSGMTVDEVERVMGRYSRGPGAKWGVPTPPAYPTGSERAAMTGSMLYRWNETDGRYDSDWGKVSFERGKVVGVEFLPD